MNDRCLNSRNTKIKEIEQKFLEELYFEKGENFYYGCNDKAKEKQINEEIKNFTSMLKQKFNEEEYEKAFKMFNKILVDKNDYYSKFNQYCYTEGIKVGIKLF